MGYYCTSVSKYSRGGKKLKKFIADARVAQGKGVKEIKVGVFSTATYPDGTPVAVVAAVNEFGTTDGHIPERPAFRNANVSVKPRLVQTLAREIDPTKLVVTPDIANRLGLQWQAEIQDNIVRLRSPPNAPSTVRAKKSANPLVDTGNLRLSVTYSVE